MQRRKAPRENLIPLEPSHEVVLENLFHNFPRRARQAVTKSKRVGLQWLKFSQIYHPCQGAFWGLGKASFLLRPASWGRINKLFTWAIACREAARCPMGARTRMPLANRVRVGMSIMSTWTLRKRVMSRPCGTPFFALQNRYSPVQIRVPPPANFLSFNHLLNPWTCET